MLNWYNSLLDLHINTHEGAVLQSHSTAYSNHGGLLLARSILANPDPPPVQPNNQLGWCTCGKCRAMELPIEKLCCKQ